MQKLLDMENLSGREYFLPIGSTTDKLSTFIQSSEEVTKVFQYNQTEFQESYGPNLCTIYGPMTGISSLVGRELTKNERWELATLRTQTDDWNPAMGANVSTGVDIVVKWWNTRNPDNKVVSFMIENNSLNRKNVLKKKYAYVSGFYGNQKYNIDAQDGLLEGIAFGQPTYGHCTAELLSTVLDNYDNKYDRRDYNGCVKNLVIHRTGFVLFRENGLTDSAKKQLSAMRKGIWNGSGADRKALRSEALTMLARYAGKTAEQLVTEGVWNGMNGSVMITQAELDIVYQRMGLTFRSKDTKRGSIAESLW